MKSSTSDVPIGTARPPSRNTARSAASQENAVRDADLVQRFKAGDESAFVEIMARYRARIFSVTQNLLHNGADAEEITQDTFVRAHRCLAGFRGDSSLATWLHRIAVNLARNRYWYYFRRRRHATVSLDCPVGEDSASPLSDLISAGSPEPSRAAECEEFSELVARCMNALEAHHQRVLVLRNVQNLSYDEIAVQLCINVGTVKSRIARARESLRMKLAETCPEFEADADPSDWFEPDRSAGLLAPAWA